MSILERFLRYVKIDTMSSDDATSVPSTSKQFDLAVVLAEELAELGLVDVSIDNHAIVTGTLPTNTDKKDYVIGFNAHLDTIPGFSGTNVNPNVIYNYDGKDIVLKNNIVISNEKFPFLSNLIGKTLITTDGTTVLGADDKAGIAAIMGMLEYFKEHKDVEHVTIKVAFSPDEEIGGGLDEFDVKAFGADFAYTVDGNAYNVINFECFNAASAKVHINGLDIHPGSAFNKMINAADIATEFEQMLPAHDKPMYTRGYEGFNHLCYIHGETGFADMEFILRNHDLAKLEAQKDLFREITAKLNAKYGKGVVNLELIDSYRNMGDIVGIDSIPVKRCKERMHDLGIEMVVEPIRGGTDGALLTRKGMPTPNLGTGGYNCHGPYEFACLEEMQLVCDILCEIAKTK